jgi:tetratricopeptide (TPR) repeat protein
LSEGCRRLAIHGLGGCGKTALALETAYRTREKYPACAIFWVPAISQETFEQAYREMGLLLRIPGITDPNADVKQLVKARLSDESFKSWLMIIDNADDDSVLFESPKDRNRTNRLFDYIPLNRRGSIIFTTRTRKAAVRLAGANLLQIKELNEVDAKSMLDQYLHKKDLLRDDSIVHDFLELLTYLPLAIVQAMAFVIGNDIQLSEYINIYKGSDKDATDLLSKDFEDMGRYPQTENPVATTWYISFNRIREQNKLAAEYLSQMAFTTGEAIPVSLLRHGRTQIETTEALGTLTAYAFVTERQQQRSSPDPPQQERMFDMHQLVRLATCNWLREHDEWHFWTNEALTRLIEIVPYGDQYTWRTWITYLPHAVHVVDLPEVYHKENRVLLLQNVGACEYALGRYTAAERIERLVVERRQCMFGIQHPYTLWSMRSLATTLLQLYKYTEAEQILRETLTLQTKLLGKEHRDTLQCSQDLAEVLRQQSKHLEAEKILQETLTLQEKTLGKAHFDTLWSSSYLELVFVDQGKYVEAEMSIRNTLALREMTFGKESLETLKSRHYLGRVLDEQKKYEEAEVVYRHSATLHKKIFGEEHPETLKNISRLGSVLYSQGKYEEAEVIFREAVESSERSSGGDHFDTLVYTLSYATIIRYQHRYDEALPFYERAFIGFRKTLGIQHQQTQNCLYYWDHTRLLAAARLSESEKQDIIYELAQGYRSVPRNSRKFVRASRPRANSVHSEGPSKRERVLRPRARTVVGSHENWDCMNGTR